MSPTGAAGEQKHLRLRGLRLAWFIVAWDTVEGIVAVTAGLAAGSIALVGFGIDSAIEVFAASVVIWQLRGGAHALGFFVLATYVALEATRDLVTADKAEDSFVGIALYVVALTVMVPVAIAQKRTGLALGNAVLVPGMGREGFPPAVP